MRENWGGGEIKEKFERIMTNSKKVGKGDRQRQTNTQNREQEIVKEKKRREREIIKTFP